MQQSQPVYLRAARNFGLSGWALIRAAIQIWQQERKTIVFVTHDIHEAVTLADRVLVMSQRPSHCRESVVTDLPRPRDLESPECSALCRQLMASIDPAAAMPPSAAPDSSKSDS